MLAMVLTLLCQFSKLPYNEVLGDVRVINMVKSYRPVGIIARKRDRIPNFPRNKAKFEVYGEEMIEKEVKQSGNSGRVYLPPDWIGK